MEGPTMQYILAWIGVGIMLGVTAACAGLGFGMVCSAALGALKKGAGFGPLMILSAIPSTNGIYGFVAFIMYMGTLTTIGDALTMFQGATILGAGLIIAIGVSVTCIYQAKIATDGIVAVGSGHKEAFGKTLILAAYPEFFAILSLVGAILVMGTLQ